MSKGSKIKMNIGTSSFVVIFVIVALATFAVLSLVSANANKNTTNKSVNQIDEYYKMNNAAQAQLKEIDTLLNTTFQQTTSPEQYFETIAQTLNLTNYQYTFTIEGTIQNLVITLEIKYPNVGQTFYDIISWNKEAKEEWNPKNNTNLLKAEDIYGNTRTINDNHKHWCV